MHSTITPSGITPIPEVCNVPTQQLGESPHAYGLRLYQWMLKTGAIAAMLETMQAEHAYAASIHAIIAPDMTPTTRERLSAIRYDLAVTIQRRHREHDQAMTRLTALLADIPEAPPANGGGSKVPTHPAPPQPPTPAAVLPRWADVADPF